MAHTRITAIEQLDTRLHLPCHTPEPSQPQRQLAVGAAQRGTTSASLSILRCSGNGEPDPRCKNATPTATGRSEAKRDYASRAESTWAVIRPARRAGCGVLHAGPSWVIAFGGCRVRRIQFRCTRYTTCFGILWSGLGASKTTVRRIYKGLYALLCIERVFLFSRTRNTRFR